MKVLDDNIKKLNRVIEKKDEQIVNQNEEIEQ
jgi:hypothetical protein